MPALCLILLSAYYAKIYTSVFDADLIIRAIATWVKYASIIGLLDNPGINHNFLVNHVSIWHHVTTNTLSDSNISGDQGRLKPLGFGGPSDWKEPFFIAKI